MSKRSPRKQRPKCKYCGSLNVRLDGFAKFDFSKQKWVLADTYDKGWCADCEEEQDYFDWEDANEKSKQKTDRKTE